MADNFIPQGSYRDIQVQSPTSVIDVMTLTAYSQPSNIFYEVNVPLDAYNSGDGDQYLADAAAALEELAATEGVASVHYATDLDASGLIGEYAVATLKVDAPKGSTGPFTSEVRFPLSSLTGGSPVAGAARQSALSAQLELLQQVASS